MKIQTFQICLLLQILFHITFQEKNVSFAKSQLKKRQLQIGKKFTCDIRQKNVLQTFYNFWCCRACLKQKLSQKKLLEEVFVIYLIVIPGIIK